MILTDGTNSEDNEGGVISNEMKFTSSQQVIQVGDRLFAIPLEALQKHLARTANANANGNGNANANANGGPLALAMQKNKGILTIQRSPKRFRFILEYLINGIEGFKAALKGNTSSSGASSSSSSANLSGGKVNGNQGILDGNGDVAVEVLEEILIEAEFYQLPELSLVVKGMLKPELSREVIQHLLKRHTAPRDFTGARLVGLDLSNLDFVTVEIKGKESKYLPTVVHRCEFKPIFNESNLQWANFSHSILPNSQFKRAKLSYTNFTEADLSHSDFTGAQFIKANLTKANLTGINFQQVTLQQCQFAEAILTEVNFENTHVSTVTEEQQQQPQQQQAFSIIPGCDFQKSHFLNANLKNANFAGCMMKGASFVQCNLEGVNLDNACLEQASFMECDLTGAFLRHTNLKSAQIIQCQVTSTLLNHANLMFAQLFSSTFKQAQLVGANLQCAELFEYSLDDADKELIYKNHASFAEANLRFSQLQGVDFHGVNCAGADFRDSNLTNAVMKDTNLANANLEGAVLKRRIVEDFDANWIVTKKGKTMEDGSFQKKN